MKKAEEYYIKEMNLVPPLQHMFIKAIKQAQIDAIEEAVKRCYDES